jgi:hypothetical protein
LSALEAEEGINWDRTLHQHAENVTRGVEKAFGFFLNASTSPKPISITSSGKFPAAKPNPSAGAFGRSRGYFW